MLETLDEWRDDAADVIRRYGAWKRNDVEKVLNRPTGGKAGRIEVENLVSEARQKAAEARAILSRPGAGGAANAPLVRDLTKIAEELELGTAEGESIATPDAVWQNADEQTKRKLTQKIPIPADKADRLRARFRGDLRDQKAPPDDTPGGGNGKPK